MEINLMTKILSGVAGLAIITTAATATVMNNLNSINTEEELLNSISTSQEVSSLLSTESISTDPIQQTVSDGISQIKQETSKAIEEINEAKSVTVSLSSAQRISVDDKPLLANHLIGKSLNFNEIKINFNKYIKDIKNNSITLFYQFKGLQIDTSKFMIKDIDNNTLSLVFDESNNSIKTLYSNKITISYNFGTVEEPNIQSCDIDLPTE